MKDKDRIYPTMAEALKLVDRNEAAWRPFYEKPITTLLDQALKEPTGVSYEALTISDERALIVVCIAGTLDVNRGLIAALNEKVGGNVIDALPPHVTLGELATDAFKQQALTVSVVREPHAAVIVGADPVTVAFIEKEFLKK